MSRAAFTHDGAANARAAIPSYVVYIRKSGSTLQKRSQTLFCKTGKPMHTYTWYCSRTVRIAAQMQPNSSQESELIERRFSHDAIFFCSHLSHVTKLRKDLLLLEQSTSKFSFVFSLILRIRRKLVIIYQSLILTYFLQYSHSIKICLEFFGNLLKFINF